MVRGKWLGVGLVVVFLSVCTMVFADKNPPSEGGKALDGKSQTQRSLEREFASETHPWGVIHTIRLHTVEGGIDSTGDIEFRLKASLADPYVERMRLTEQGLEVTGNLDVSGDATIEGKVTSEELEITENALIEGDARIEGKLEVGSQTVTIGTTVEDTNQIEFTNLDGQITGTGVDLTIETTGGNNPITITAGGNSPLNIDSNIRLTKNNHRMTLAGNNRLVIQGETGDPVVRTLGGQALVVDGAGGLNLNTLGVAATTIGGDAVVNGNATLGDAATDTHTINGDTTANHDLTVLGNVALGDTAGDTVNIAGPITGSNNLTILGNTTLGDDPADTVDIAGNTTIGGTADIAGDATFAGNVTLGDNVSDTVTIPGALIVVGSITNQTITGTQLVSTAAQGVAPLQVTSTTKVDNLNVDQVDGFDASATATANQLLALDENGEFPAEVIPDEIARDSDIITDHGGLDGLGDDDHTQYLTPVEHAAVDTNLSEEAPTLNARGEPTGQEIRNWADDITVWGHGNVVTNLNADRLDDKEASDFALSNHTHALADLSDVSNTGSSDLAAALTAAGKEGANGTDEYRLATMADLGPLPAGGAVRFARSGVTEHVQSASYVDTDTSISFNLDNETDLLIEYFMELNSFPSYYTYARVQFDAITIFEGFVKGSLGMAPETFQTESLNEAVLMEDVSAGSHTLKIQVKRGPGNIWNKNLKITEVAME